MYARNTCASEDEIYEAAFHEVAHCLVANAVGARVYGASVKRDAGGGADMGAMPNAVADVRVTVAGYVAESFLHGVTPTWEDMQKHEANELDCGVINDLAASGDIRAEIAIPSAIRFAQYILTQPAMVAKHIVLARTLARRRYLWGQMLR